MQTEAEVEMLGALADGGIRDSVAVRWSKSLPHVVRNAAGVATGLEVDGQPIGSSGGGGFGFAGDAGSEAAMTGLSASVGSECLRTDVGGTGGTLYELTADPAGTAANWQPLQGSIGASVITLSLIEGKWPRKLLVWVAAATEVTVSDGTSTYILWPSTYPHVLPIYDEPGAAMPASLTIERTTGSATTGRYSLES